MTAATFTFPSGGRMLREHFKIDYFAVFQSRNRMRGASRLDFLGRPVLKRVFPHPPQAVSLPPAFIWRSKSFVRDKGGRQIIATLSFVSVNFYWFVNASGY
jgi:hypothetical protein